MLIPLAIYFAKKSYHFKSLLAFSAVFDYSGDLKKNQELSDKWEAF
jgi:hypothetical protein